MPNYSALYSHYADCVPKMKGGYVEIKNPAPLHPDLEPLEQVSRMHRQGPVVHGEDLYKRAALLLQGFAVKARQYLDRVPEAAFLPSFLQESRAYVQAARCFDTIFRSFLRRGKPSDGHPPFAKLGAGLWHSCAVKPLLARLCGVVARRFHEVRIGALPLNDSATVVSVIALLAVRSDDEEELVDGATAAFHRLERALLDDAQLRWQVAIKPVEVPVQQWAIDELAQSEEREDLLATTFQLQPSTREQLKQRLWDAYRASRLDSIATSFNTYLDLGQHQYLRPIADVVERLDSGRLVQLGNYFQVFATELLDRMVLLIAKGAVNTPHICRLYVESLLDFHARLGELMAKWLTPAFRPALASAFRLTINKNELTRLGFHSARLLSRYLDWLLRAGHLQANEDEDAPSVEQRLATCLDALFPLLEAKADFLQFYAKDLANRMLYRLSSSESLEQLAVNALRSSVDKRALEQLTRMFNDMFESMSFQEAAKQALDKSPSRALDFNILMLSPGQWPVPLVHYQFATAAYPAIAGFEQVVADAFLKKYPGKKLSMLHHYARGHLTANFASGAGEYTLICSGTQTAVLLLFADVYSHTYADIANATKLPDNELNLALQSLVTAALLVPDPPPFDSSTPFRPSHVFCYNHLFASPRTRLRISELLPMKSSTDRSSDQNAALAAIVRIIKPRSSLTYRRLLPLLLTELESRFQPDSQLITSALAALVDRGILSYHPETLEYSYVLE